VVAIAVILALGFAFYVFFAPFVGSKMHQYIVIAIYTPLVVTPSSNFLLLLFFVMLSKLVGGCGLYEIFDSFCLFLCLTFLVCLDGGVWRERGRMVIFWKTM
jgi:hypothetical protein